METLRNIFIDSEKDLTPTNSREPKPGLFFYPPDLSENKTFQIQNRRFLGNKYKLSQFIKDVVDEKCGSFDSFCDIFAGTGVVGNIFNNPKVKIISNDILESNVIPLKTFLGTTRFNSDKLQIKINLLNSITTKKDNYFSNNYGNTYFTLENARKIGHIRSEIENIAESESERNVLITSLIYATDKVANTVGHYDAFRKTLDSTQPVELLIPRIQVLNNSLNEIHQEDANKLISSISCDVLYIDPPYNSRQYSDSYHLLENLATWREPDTFGKAKKMDRSNLKSDYCSKNATVVFEHLIKNADAKHILVSYNNTGETKHGRSNSKIKDDVIVKILKNKGEVKIFERNYRAFTTGKSETFGHTERLFYCRVDKNK